MNRTLDLLWLRVRTYFKHPAEDIRQAKPIIPGRLYSNFGYICKAIPLNEREKLFIRQTESQGALPPELLGDIRPDKDMIHQLIALRQMPDIPNTDLPSRCNFCDFYRNGLPCPVYNILKDRTTVCDSHKYVILKNQ